MPKPKANTIYLCRECGAQQVQHYGRCPECGQFGTLEAETLAPEPAGRGAWLASAGSLPQELTAVAVEGYQRMALPFQEINRVLGGGIVPGSLVLISGDPGIGKSTLLLQLAAGVAEPSPGGKGQRVLYVSGEESLQQIKLRARRLGIHGQDLFLLAETDVDAVLHHLEELKPALAIIDSIQTVLTSELPAAPGSAGQIRDCTHRLLRWAKASNIPVWLSCHVTKEGAIAGPMLLEHMVDVVLYLEGEQLSAYRLLRGMKNRFGSTNEVGVFEMRDAGLQEVEDPSQFFLRERAAQAAGSVIVPSLQGVRPMLVEVQALVSPTAFAQPRRVANGIEFNRLLMILAVLSKHLHLPLGQQDVIVNVAGGLKVHEPAADLGVALAVVSSLRETPVAEGLLAVGEVGLSGELRSVGQMDRRLAEAAKLGFQHCVLPRRAVEGARVRAAAGQELMPAASLREAVWLAVPRVGRQSPGMSKGVQDDDLDLLEVEEP